MNMNDDGVPCTACGMSYKRCKHRQALGRLKCCPNCHHPAPRSQDAPRGALGPRPACANGCGWMKRLYLREGAQATFKPSPFVYCPTCQTVKREKK